MIMNVTAPRVDAACAFSAKRARWYVSVGLYPASLAVCLAAAGVYRREHRRVSTELFVKRLEPFANDFEHFVNGFEPLTNGFEPSANDFSHFLPPIELEIAFSSLEDYLSAATIASRSAIRRSSTRPRERAAIKRSTPAL